jgi:hypothetical protein
MACNGDVFIRWSEASAASGWLERLVRRRGRQRAGTRGADASDAAVLARDCFEHVHCEPYVRAPADAN